MERPCTLVVCYFDKSSWGSVNLIDQFLSAGHNDFKARLAATCVWVSSPAETVKCLEELTDQLDLHINPRGSTLRYPRYREDFF